jgi:CheY-like chemotaxis protein/predicted regulator of Ras-like GTPase activity (Roadblock/LC7/MglB family)
MLQQSLEETSQCVAIAVNSGRDALKAAEKNSYSLAIVDMGVKDVEATSLVRRLREAHPKLALMVIPLHGDAPPQELSDCNLQGTLPKPFFLPELPERVEAALESVNGQSAVVDTAYEAGDEPTEEVTPASDLRIVSSPDLSRQITRLFQEVGAQAVMLTQGQEIVNRISRLPDDETVALADIIHESWHTSARVAKILGKEQLRFEQSIEGDEHLLYSLAVSQETILSVVVEGHIPLGMIRHRTKGIAETIRQLLGLTA